MDKVATYGAAMPTARTKIAPAEGGTAVPLRALRPSDVAQLVALSRQLGGYETEEDWSGVLARSREGRAAAFGLEVGGELVGYAAAEVRVAFGLPVATGWIESFAVGLPWRGRGYGRALVEAVFSRLSELGAERVLTLVPLHDLSTAPFFRELGFREEPLRCLGRSL